MTVVGSTHHRAHQVLADILAKMDPSITGPLLDVQEADRELTGLRRELGQVQEEMTACRKEIEEATRTLQDETTPLKNKSAIRAKLEENLQRLPRLQEEETNLQAVLIPNLESTLGAKAENLANTIRELFSASEKRAGDSLAAMLVKIDPEIRSFLTARDEAETKLARLQKTLANNETAVSSLKGRIEMKMQAVSEVIGAGGDPGPGRVEIRNLRQELAEAQEWIEKLREEMVPTARQAHTRARDAATAAVRGALVAVRKEYGELLGQLTSNLLGGFDAWDHVLGDWFQKNGIGLQPFYVECLPMQTRQYSEDQRQLLAYVSGIKG
ncbi:MAG: hypothetical protein WAW37_05865 [Syntrophobacteraceae bacterium]